LARCPPISVAPPLSHERQSGTSETMSAMKRKLEIGIGLVVLPLLLVALFGSLILQSNIGLVLSVALLIAATTVGRVIHERDW
jgi:hypothetical protein